MCTHGQLLNKSSGFVWRFNYKYNKDGPGSLVGTSYAIPAVVAIESNFGPQKIQLQGVLFEGGWPTLMLQQYPRIFCCRVSISLQSFSFIGKFVATIFEYEIMCYYELCVSRLVLLPSNPRILSQISRYGISTSFPGPNFDWEFQKFPSKI